jgi:hypothetical protein
MNLKEMELLQQHVQNRQETINECFSLWAILRQVGQHKNT